MEQNNLDPPESSDGSSLIIKEDDMIDNDSEEEIELESEEHELFLRDEYVTTDNNILPFRVSNQHQHNFKARMPNSLNLDRRINQRRCNITDKLINTIAQDIPPKTPMEQFYIDDSGRGSQSPLSTIIYQMPNYEQFASKLAPKNSTSVIVSFLIIFVILAVTIVPKIVLQSSSPANEPDDFYDDYDDIYSDEGYNMEVNNDKTSTTTATADAQQRDLQRPMHSDVRCKCICPPFPKLNDTRSMMQLSQRRLYVGNTRPNQCNCQNIVMSHFKTDTSMLLKEFCVKCECKYQSRNTGTIRRNIVFFIAVLTGLAIYLTIQYVLKHFRITRRSLPRHLKWLHHQTENESY